MPTFLMRLAAPEPAGLKYAHGVTEAGMLTGRMVDFSTVVTFLRILSF